MQGRRKIADLPQTATVSRATTAADIFNGPMSTCGSGQNRLKVNNIGSNVQTAWVHSQTKEQKKKREGGSAQPWAYRSVGSAPEWSGETTETYSSLPGRKFVGFDLIWSGFYCFCIVLDLEIFFPFCLMFFFFFF